jgi:hypothetical protein
LRRSAVIDPPLMMSAALATRVDAMHAMAG